MKYFYGKKNVNKMDCKLDLPEQQQIHICYTHEQRKWSPTQHYQTLIEPVHGK